MHKLGTVAFLLFGFAIVGYVTLFASNTQSQFTALQSWVKTEGWEFERPGNRISYRITAPNWTLEAIQGDKKAPPSLDAKPKTIWRTRGKHDRTSFVLTPFLPPEVYTNVEHRSRNQERLFEYILGDEASHFSSLVQTSLPEELAPHFTYFRESSASSAPLDYPQIRESLEGLRENLQHSPIVTANPRGLSVRAQTMIFGPKTLQQLIQFSTQMERLAQAPSPSPVAVLKNEISIK